MLVDCPRFFWPATIWWQNSNTVGVTSGMLLDAGDEKAALIFQPPKAGSIRKVHFRTGTVTTGATIDVRFETVASSLPTGTLWGTNTNVSHVLANGDDDLFLTTAALTADAVVTQTNLDNGDWMALVFVNPSVSPGNFYIAATPISGQGSSPSLFGAFGAHYTSSWNRNSTITELNVAVEYSDGTIELIVGIQPCKSIGNLAINSGSDPDEIALKWTQMGRVRASGWYAAAFSGAVNPIRAQIYEDGNNTPIASAIYDGTTTSSGGGSTAYFGKFPTPVELTNGTIYRLGLLPTSGSSFQTRYIEQESNAIFAACEMGTDAIWSQRNRSSTTDPDAASWSDTNTRRPVIGLMCDQIDDGGPTNAEIAQAVWEYGNRELTA